MAPVVFLSQPNYLYWKKSFQSNDWRTLKSYLIIAKNVPTVLLLVNYFSIFRWCYNQKIFWKINKNTIFIVCLYQNVWYFAFPYQHLFIVKICDSSSTTLYRRLRLSNSGESMSESNYCVNLHLSSQSAYYSRPVEMSNRPQFLYHFHTLVI